MTEKFEDIKMKYVILETWKNKLGYPLNYKDIEELENIIDYYKQESEQLNERIDKAIEYIEKASDWEWESLAYQDLLELLKGDSK